MDWLALSISTAIEQISESELIKWFVKQSNKLIKTAIESGLCSENGMFNIVGDFGKYLIKIECSSITYIDRTTMIPILKIDKKNQQQLCEISKSLIDFVD